MKRALAALVLAALGTFAAIGVADASKPGTPPGKAKNAAEGKPKKANGRAKKAERHGRNAVAVQSPSTAKKRTICHRTGPGRYVRIAVSVHALPAHRAHGDVVPDAGQTLGDCPARGGGTTTTAEDEDDDQGATTAETETAETETAEDDDEGTTTTEAETGEDGETDEPETVEQPPQDADDQGGEPGDDD